MRSISGAKQCLRSSETSLGRPSHCSYVGRSQSFMMANASSFAQARRASGTSHMAWTMDNGQERSQPGLDGDEAAIGSKHTLSLPQRLFQIVGKVGQMVQPALDDEDVPRAVSEGKFSAVSEVAASGPSVLRQQRRGEVDTLEFGKPEAGKGNKAISPAAKEFHNLHFARPTWWWSSLRRRARYCSARATSPAA